MVRLEIICSMEHEYGVYSNRSEHRENLIQDFLRSVNKELILFEKNDKLFLKNGMLIYRDLGVLEIALPECSSPYQVVCYDQVATKIIEQTSAGLGLIFFKNNLDSKQNTKGCHENYFYEAISDKTKLLIQQGLEREIYAYIFPRILPFLLTRYIFAGSGNYFANDYQISQRATKIDFVNSEKHNNSRVLFHEKHEPFCNNGLRIHITCGDSNMSEFTNYLKMGTTAIVLKMIERDFIDDNLELISPLEDLVNINLDLSCKKQLINCKKRILKLIWKNIFKKECYNPIVIQQKYLNIAKKFSKFYDFNVDVLNNWEEVLVALKKNPNILSNKLDWIIKKSLIDLVNDKSLGECINLQYHSINENSFFSKISDEFKLIKTVNEKDVLNAFNNPPTTRALTRKEIVAVLVKQGFQILNMDWNFIMYQDENNTYRITIDTPFYVSLDSPLLKPELI